LPRFGVFARAIAPERPADQNTFLKGTIKDRALAFHVGSMQMFLPIKIGKSCHFGITGHPHE
jgi:hypothetical protein